MGTRGHSRTAWCEPREGTKIARLISMMKAAAVSAYEIEREVGLAATRNGPAIAYLRDQCGYVVHSWPDPALAHVGKCKRRYRITGRLAWGGGVGEDYTVKESES